jgi:hypothetical protein
MSDFEREIKWGKQITPHWTNEPINSMQQSPSWEANSSSGSLEIPSILRKDHYSAHNSKQLVPIMNHINSVHPPPPRQFYFMKTRSNTVEPLTTDTAGEFKFCPLQEVYVSWSSSSDLRRRFGE